MGDMTEEPQPQSFWKVTRDKVGRPPKFATPEELAEACAEYFQWVEDNPLKEAKFYQSDGVPGTHDMNRMRVMHIGALTTFIGVGRQTWYQWKDPSDARYRPEYADIIKWAEETIQGQQLEGASGGQLNANIISRLLGLADKKEHSGPGGGDIPISDTTSKTELARMIAFALKEGLKEVDKDG